MEFIKRTYYKMADVGINLSTVIPEDTTLASYLKDRYGYNWVIYADNRDTFSLDMKDKWIAKFYNIYNLTKDRYHKLLELYQAQENNLLAKIGSSTKTKFNDTPQNAGSFDTEEYTTTYTQVDTETDPTSVMARLSEIHNLYINIYREWIEEFKILFGEEID